MIDLAQLRREHDTIKAALLRRGVTSDTMNEILSLDVEHRRLLQGVEALRAEVKELSRQVAGARRDADVTRADTLRERSRAIGDEERVASEETEQVATTLREMLLMIPNIPDDKVPDG